MLKPQPLVRISIYQKKMINFFLQLIFCSAYLTWIPNKQKISKIKALLDQLEVFKNSQKSFQRHSVYTDPTILGLFPLRLRGRGSPLCELRLHSADKNRIRVDEDFYQADSSSVYVDWVASSWKVNYCTGNFCVGFHAHKSLKSWMFHGLASTPLSTFSSMSASDLLSLEA